jgi:TonB-linked SusC/RagA family outer membrane protein
MVISVSFAIAQETTVTGVVSAEEEGPLPGVNVTVQGTTTGVMTGVDGSYSIKVPGPNAVLVFSSIGYTTQNITVGTKTKIDVTLVSDVKALQEVVVTGYTVQRRRDLTGSVATVAPAELTAVPTGNVTNALQGRTSGVTVVGNGQPNSTARVRIRGFSSFENNDPLYVVDGVPTQDISTLNPNDIESLSVLKDAGAASIYGSRASNGVIIISTKKGGRGAQVAYNMYTGWQFPGSGPNNLLNTQEYAQLQWLVNKNDQTPVTTLVDGVPTQVIHPLYGWIGNPQPTLPSWAANTNWYKAITHVAPLSNHDLSFSGGGDNSKFYAGLGIRRQEGIVIYTNQNKYTGRFNSEFTFLNSRVKVGENFTGTYATNLGVGNLGEGSPISMGAYRMQPIIPVRWTGDDFVGLSHTFKAGEYAGTGLAASLGNATNSVANLTRAKDNTNWNIRLIGNTYIDLRILTGLNFRSSIGGTMYTGYGTGYTFATYENAENTGSNSFNENTFYGSDWVFTNTVTLDKTFGAHRLLAVAGYEASSYGIGRNMNASRGGYFTDDPLFRTLSNGATINSANSDLNTPTTLVSQFMRADYQFMERYMLSATVRRDGSSRFGADYRYGVFPSFSLGWRLSDEDFFSGLKTFVNEFKLRGSYGTMGNQLAVSPINQFYAYGGDPGSAFYDINGAFTGSVQGFRPTRIGNPSAKWETNITADIGFEATLWDSKLGFKFDWYSKKTKDLLFAPELPGTSGAADAPYINIAAMSNTGVDLELNYNQKWGDLGFSAIALLTTYKNNIDKIAEGVNFFDYGGGTTRIGANNRNQVGHPMSSFYGYKVIGLFQSDADVSESPKQDGAEPGFFKFQDTNKDGQITPEDRVFIGNPNPNFTYSFNLSFNFKNFDLTAFLYGSQGADIFNWNTWWIDFWPSFQGQKSTELLYNSWTPDRPNATVPKASNKSNFSNNTQVNDYYIEPGGYLRMRTLELGYKIPTGITNRLTLQSLRVYVQAVNLFTLTKYSGLDPELGGDDRAFGSDTGNYPLVRNFIFGLNVNF